MPRDGTGQYNLPNSAVVTGTAISSTDENATRSDLATALTGSLARDGQALPTANLPMGTFKHTGVGDATARNQYPSLGQMQDGDADWRGVAGGTGDAITFTTTPATVAYTAGETDVFLVSADNTGGVTINKNGLGTKALQTGSGAALAAGLLKTGMTVTTRYDGTQFRITALGGTNTGGALLTAPDAASARVAAGAPAIPTASVAVGQFVLLTPAAAAAFVLPASGTWAYFGQLLNSGVVANAAAGVGAGGATVGAGVGGQNWVGFAWRVS